MLDGFQYLISIHAPHARSDARRLLAHGVRRYFNPRSSCEERRPFAPLTSSHCGFQSTLLMRGATLTWDIVHIGDVISIHAPHARSDSRTISRRLTHSNFNPRSSCEERHSMMAFWKSSSLFQSTLLMRGATVRSLSARADSSISIHAPHARSDADVMGNAACRDHFNPRSSCEERPDKMRMELKEIQFQSTLLMRGATTVCASGLPCLLFQSTLLMRGATRLVDDQLRRQYFNPRSSCEERRERFAQLLTHLLISIHAPHARSDPRKGGKFSKRSISIHAPHARSDLSVFCRDMLNIISIHAPHARSDRQLRRG